MESIKLHYDVSGNDFTCAGEASGKIKRELKGLGFPNETEEDFEKLKNVLDMIEENT